MTRPAAAAVVALAADALELRDQALAALDAGNAQDGLAMARRGLAILGEAGLSGGLDEAAMLVALAEIEECDDRLAQARVTITTAIAILDRVTPDGGAEPGSCALWCQAQERLAGLERLATEFSAAAARLGAVLDKASATFGEHSRQVVSAANALGVVYKHASDLDAAEAAYRRALAAEAKLPDHDPLVEAGLLHNLGGLAHARGDFGAGIPLAERGARLRATGLGADHQDVARDLNALGALYHLAGRLDDAARACQRALMIFERHYGPAHLEVAMACANLSVLDTDQGRYRDAEALGLRSLRIFEDVLGPSDAEVGLTLLNLAAAVAGQGRHAEAATLTTRAAAILTTSLPPGHPHAIAAAEELRSA